MSKDFKNEMKQSSIYTTAHRHTTDCLHFYDCLCVFVPGDAEEIVECGAELFHAGLIWTKRDGQDQTTTPVFAPLREKSEQKERNYYWQNCR